MANKETIHVPARQLQVVGATLDELKTNLLENEIGWSEADKALFYKTTGGDVLPIGGGGGGMQLSFVASKDSDFVSSFYIVNTNATDKQLSVQVSSPLADEASTDAFDGYWQYTCELDYCLITIKLPDTFIWKVRGKYDRVSGGILVSLSKGQTVVLHQYYDTLAIDLGKGITTETTLANSSNDLVATSFGIIASKVTKRGEALDDGTVGTSFNITGSTFEPKESV